MRTNPGSRIERRSFFGGSFPDLQKFNNEKFIGERGIQINSPEASKVYSEKGRDRKREKEEQKVVFPSSIPRPHPFFL